MTEYEKSKSFSLYAYFLLLLFTKIPLKNLVWIVQQLFMQVGFEGALVEKSAG